MGVDGVVLAVLLTPLAIFLILIWMVRPMK
jgi:hypothetical protein